MQDAATDLERPHGRIAPAAIRLRHQPAARAAACADTPGPGSVDPTSGADPARLDLRQQAQ